MNDFYTFKIPKSPIAPIPQSGDPIEWSSDQGDRPTPEEVDSAQTA